MACVTISREWPDGESLTIAIDVDESFPDCVAEARQACVRGYQDALEVTLAPDQDEASD